MHNMPEIISSEVMKLPTKFLDVTFQMCTGIHAVLSPFRVEQEQKCSMGHFETLIYELPFQSTAVSASEINRLAGLNAQILCTVYE